MLKSRPWDLAQGAGIRNSDARLRVHAHAHAHAHAQAGAHAYAHAHAPQRQGGAGAMINADYFGLLRAGAASLARLGAVDACLNRILRESDDRQGIGRG